MRINILQDHPLFLNLSPEQIHYLSEYYRFTEKKYHKNEYLLLEGEFVEYVGIIAKGTILMEKNDISGNQYFFTELREHEIFAEPFIDHSVRTSFVNYKAITNCTIYLFHYTDLWKRLNQPDLAHIIFTENLFCLLARKTRGLLLKMELLSKKTIRERILTLLFMLKSNPDLLGFSKPSEQTLTLKDYSSDTLIAVPLNRTELAEYLCVNRSALVRELSHMKNEKLLDYEDYIYHLSPS